MSEEQETPQVRESVFWIFSLLLGIGLGFVFQHFGLSATPDSIAYMDASLAFQEFRIELETFWGPFYPILLAVFSFFYFPAEAACFINGIALSLLMTGTVRLARSFHFSWVGLILIAFLPLIWTDIWHVHRVIWSGGTFLALIVLHFVYLQQYLRKPTIGSWFLLNLMAGLALLTRYVGYFFVPHIGIILLLHRNKAGFVPKILLSILAYIPHVLWLISNYQRSGTLHGVRTESQFSLLENMDIFWQVASEIAMAGSGITLFAIFGIVGVVKAKKISLSQSDRWWVYSLLASSIIFSGLLLYSATSVAIDRLNARLTAPLYPMILLLSLFGVSSVSQLFSEKKKNIQHISIVGMVLLSVVTQVFASPDRDGQKWIKISQKRGEYSHVPFLGFANTKTHHSLGEAIRKEIGNTDHLHLLWLEGQKFNNYFKLVLFRDIISDENMKIGHISSQQAVIEAPLFTESGIKTISVHNTGTINNLAELKKRMERVFGETEKSELFLVGRKAYLKRIQANQFSWTVTNNAEEYQISCSPLHYPALYTMIQCQKEITLVQSSEEKESQQRTEKMENSVKQEIKNSEQKEDSFSVSTEQIEDWKNIQITEIMAFPTKVKKWRGEWFELYNSNDKEVNLKGLELFSKGNSGLRIETDVVVAPQSYILFATRNDSAVNGGLPNADYGFLSSELSFHHNDWIELRYKGKIFDRFELPKEWVKDGISVSKTTNGSLCFSTTSYGLGDLGTPKAANQCQ